MKASLLAKKIKELIKERKGYDIYIIDVKKLSSLTDYFIICTSDSDPQTRAICNHIKKELSKKKIKPLQIEGFEYMNWILVDYCDVVIHIFKKEPREFYNIERLWADAKITKVKND